MKINIVRHILRRHHRKICHSPACADTGIFYFHFFLSNIDRKRYSMYNRSCDAYGQKSSSFVALFLKNIKNFCFFNFCNVTDCYLCKYQKFLKSFVFHSHPLQKYFLQQEHQIYWFICKISSRFKHLTLFTTVLFVFDRMC